MTDLNTIDPGTSKGSALAGSLAGQIVTLAVLERDDEAGTVTITKGWGVHVRHAPTLYERPRVHQRMTLQKGSFIVASANDLIALDSHGMHAACYVAGPYPVRAVEPQVWKKQVAKCMHHREALKYMSTSERALIASVYTPGAAPPVALEMLLNYITKACETFGKKRKLQGYHSQVTDILDAVCLNLWATGRFRV
jgi:hypothetical protein